MYVQQVEWQYGTVRDNYKDLKSIVEFLDKLAISPAGLNRLHSRSLIRKYN